MKARFTYSGHIERELREHDGQMVTVGREVDKDERDPCVGPMWDVIFDDGYRTGAFLEELDPQPESKLLKLVDNEWKEIK